MIALALLLSAPTLIGEYNASTGYELYTIILRPDHTAFYSWRPDHPGGTEYDGTWKTDGPTVRVQLTAKKGSPKKQYSWNLVPVRWGDRNYLILDEELRDFAGQALRWTDQNKTDRAQRSEFYAGYFLKQSPQPHPRRYGKPHAPAPYADWFNWDR